MPRSADFDYLIGGSEKARRIRWTALKARANRKLCQHSDEIVFYESEEERDAYKSAPAVMCIVCKKEKLRMGVMRSHLETWDLDSQREMMDAVKLDGRAFF